MRKFFSKVGLIWFTVFLIIAPFVHATDDVAQITEPLTKIYDLVKAIISIVAVLAITFAGVRFMFSGDDLKAREGAKSMIGYAVMGLVIVWIAPVLVNFLTAPPV